jgi:hypothetical protein
MEWLHFAGFLSVFSGSINMPEKILGNCPVVIIRNSKILEDVSPKINC